MNCYLAGFILIVAAVGCGRAPAPAQAPAQAQAQAQDPAAAPGLGAKSERRVPRPPVIGGCGASCSTPEAAVAFFLTQLQHQDRIAALRPLFEWSLLVVDGQPLGAQWADMWSDPQQHAARAQQIDQWLLDWTSWLARMDDPAGLGHARSTGIRLVHPEGATDRVVVSFRHPHLHNDRTDPVWQLQWTLRGDEWLLSGIEQRPQPQK